MPGTWQGLSHDHWNVLENGSLSYPSFAVSRVLSFIAPQILHLNLTSWALLIPIPIPGVCGWGLPWAWTRSRIWKRRQPWDVGWTLRLHQRLMQTLVRGFASRRRKPSRAVRRSFEFPGVSNHHPRCTFKLSENSGIQLRLWLLLICEGWESLSRGVCASAASRGQTI